MAETEEQFETITLYKYTTFASALKILATCQLISRNPSDFNDPFDCHLDTVRTFDEQIFEETFFAESESLISDSSLPLSASGHPDVIECIKDYRTDSTLCLQQKTIGFRTDCAKYVEFMKEQGRKDFSGPEWIRLLDSIRIVCLSATHKDVLMWSYYADRHKGAVIGMELPKTEQLEPVNYTQNYPENISPAVFRAKKALGLVAFNAEDLYKQHLVTKCHSWEHEAEWRIIDGDKGGAPAPDAVELPKVTKIFLGCKMREAEKKAIWKLREALHNEATIYQGKIKKLGYALEFDQVTDIRELTGMPKSQ